MKIETKPYLQHAFQFNEEEIRLQNELLQKLPSEIIDIHSHIGLASHADGLDTDLLSNLITVYPYFPYQDHIQTREKLWGKFKNIQQVVFTFPFRGIDIRKGNEYIQEIQKQDQSFIPFLTGDPYDIDYTINQLRTGRWKGVKMYPRQLKPPGKKIVDFYPLPILEEIDDLSSPVIMHLPTNIVEDVDELTNLAQLFSNITFIVAHFGRARWDFNAIREALAATNPYGNIVYETSWYTNPDIICEGLTILGYERILYGSDQPLNLVRANIVRDPTSGERVLTDYPYHWVDFQEQIKYREITGLDPSRFPNVHFQSISAVITAIETVYVKENLTIEAKQKVFHDNSLRLLKL